MECGIHKVASASSLLAVFFAVLPILSYSGEFTWDGGADGKWNDPLSYKNGVAGGILPGSGDEVWIPTNTTVNIDVTDSESFSVFANVKRIRPESDTSKLVFDVPAGVTSVVNSAINNDAWKTHNIGYILKKGEGGLQLNSSANYRNNNNNNGRDNYVNYIIEKGAVILPQDVTYDNYRGYYGKFDIAAGAMLVTEGGASVRTYVRELTGSGLITNLCADGRLLVYCGTEGEFAGTISAPLGWYSNGRIMLTGTSSTMTKDFQHMDLHTKTSVADPMQRTQGVVGLAKIGKKGEPSSCGASETICTRDNAAAILYLGKGEVTDKTLKIFSTTTGPAYLDGGAYGGLVWAGTLCQQQSSSATQYHVNHSLVLTGSNTSECVISGTFNTYTVGDKNYDIHITKKGTGIWRFADSADNEENRTFGGSIAVEEGVLRFDSLAETGTACSVGTALNLLEYSTGGTSSAEDYAFAVGSGGVNDAVLEYVGTNVRPVSAACASERHIALKGRGTVRANGRWIGMSGVKGAAAGDHTLVLDGTSVTHNVMSDISDGVGTVSVEKRGSGTWAIGRDLSFSGALDVKEGTLLVRPADRYTWFRWTIKANASTATNGNESVVMAQELAFFDADGFRQNIGLAMNSNVHAMVCGETALDTCYGYSMNSDSAGNPRELHNLFDDARTDPGWLVGLSDAPGKFTGGYRPRLSMPDTWLPVVVRMPKGAHEIASWDWSYSLNSSFTTYNRVPMFYTLEGSVDGLNWDALSVHDTFTEAGGRYNWRFANEECRVGCGDQAHSRGEEISGRPEQVYSTLGNVRSLSVAAGAALVVDGDPVSLPSGIALAVDAQGNGRLEGFVLPKTGTVDVRNWDGESGFSGFDLSASEGWANIDGWNVTIGGEATSKLKVKASANGLSLVKLGMTIVIR